MGIRIPSNNWPLLKLGDPCKPLQTSIKVNSVEPGLRTPIISGPYVDFEDVTSPVGVGWGKGSRVLS